MDRTGTEHVLGEPVKLRYPGGKNGMFQVECSCGYRTSPYMTEEAAMKPAESHRDAKNSARSLPSGEVPVSEIRYSQTAQVLPKGNGKSIGRFR